MRNTKKIDWKTLQGHILSGLLHHFVMFGPNNRPFYSCVLSDLALDWKRGWGDLVLIQTSLLFICRSFSSYAN